MISSAVARMLFARHMERVEALAADWLDEAAAAALAKNPRRAFYLEHMARRLLDCHEAQR